MTTMNTEQGSMPDPTIAAERGVHGRGRRATWRWLVAGVATVLLVVSGTGLVAFAQTGAGAGHGPIFLPADTPIYVEARIDMPDGFEYTQAEVAQATTRSGKKAAIALDWRGSHAHFTQLHYTRQGVAR